jgi:hypothetical protein
MILWITLTLKPSIIGMFPLCVLQYLCVLLLCFFMVWHKIDSVTVVVLHSLELWPDANLSIIGLCICYLYCRLRSSLWLQFKPHHIAAGAAYLAAKLLHYDITLYPSFWQDFQTTPYIVQGKIVWLACILTCAFILFVSWACLFW